MFNNQEVMLLKRGLKHLRNDILDQKINNDPKYKAISRNDLSNIESLLEKLNKKF